MWELFSYGRNPYPRTQKEQVSSLVQSGHIMEAPEHCPPKIYDRIMKRTWCLNPDDRPTFADILCMLDDLRKDYF